MPTKLVSHQGMCLCQARLAIIGTWKYTAKFSFGYITYILPLLSVCLTLFLGANLVFAQHSFKWSYRQVGWEASATCTLVLSCQSVESNDKQPCLQTSLFCWLTWFQADPETSTICILWSLHKLILFQSGCWQMSESLAHRSEWIQI